MSDGELRRCDRCGTDYTAGERFDFCPHDRTDGLISIDDARHRRISKLRLDAWYDPREHIELQFTADGLVKPWVKHHTDLGDQEVLVTMLGNLTAPAWRVYQEPPPAAALPDPSYLCIGGPWAGRMVEAQGRPELVVHVPAPLGMAPLLSSPDKQQALDATITVEQFVYRLEGFHAPQGDIVLWVPADMTALALMQLLLNVYQTAVEREARHGGAADARINRMSLPPLP